MVPSKNDHIIQSPIQTLALVDNLCNLLGNVVEQCGKKRNRDDNKIAKIMVRNSVETSYLRDCYNQY